MERIGLCLVKNLGDDVCAPGTAKTLQIKDLMKTMDNRIIVDESTLEEYLNR